MSSRFTLLPLVLLAITITGHAQNITITTKQGFQLKADYFEPLNEENKAVLLLHQCNLNRTMYEEIGNELRLRGMHELSLDFRGFGDSTNESFDRKNLRKLPQKERRAAFKAIREYWPQDVQQAYNFLREKIGKKGHIGVIGASCGGKQAKIIAEKNSIKAINFFSSAMTNGENGAKYYKENFSEIPTLFISAEQDATYKFTQEGFTLNDNKNSKFISYKGNKHGYPLLIQDQHLAPTIAEWFDQNLIN